MRITRQLAAALEKQGYRIGRQTVAYLLDELGYSLHNNYCADSPTGLARVLNTA
jgi:hypothetical protein